MSMSERLVRLKKVMESAGNSDSHYEIDNDDDTTRVLSDIIENVCDKVLATVQMMQKEVA